MIDHSNAEIEQLAVHFVGNKTKEEELSLSTHPLEITDVRTRDFLFKYLLNPFTNPEFFAFRGPGGDISLNPVFNFVREIFNEATSFHEISQHIARFLFQISEHPHIKSGDLFVAYFSNLSVEDEISDAIGIFKCESRDAFLKLLRSNGDATAEWHEGIGLNNLDKGCLIFNTDKNSGYRLCIVDTSNKTEAQFWRDSFLQVEPREDDYHFTKEFMNITRDFTEELNDSHEMNKAEQIDLLNRSALYFKAHDKFNKEDFEAEVLQDESTINAFRSFNKSYRENNNVASPGDQFEISPEAVKRHGRVFKSVLKLDKNFHIYIHGDRDLIQQGRESDGRKFYKIYFEKEA